MSDEKKYPIHFSPLQGFTDAPYRNAHEAIFGGIDTYYTPFVRRERGDNFRSREVRDIELEQNHVRHFIPQLIAHTPEEMRPIAALLIEKGHTEVDINMGCPFPMLTRRHKGSGILPYPDDVRTLLETIKEFPTLNFSVKMRLGWENTAECLTLLPILNDTSLRQITLHSRLGIQQYKGETDLIAFEAFYKECRHPLLYNGDLCTIEEIDNITRRFPNLSGVMIGRGLLANPDLAMEYQRGTALCSDEIVERLQQFHTVLLQYYQEHLQGEAQLLCKMKTLWEYLLPETDKKIKKHIAKSTKLGTYRTAVQEAFNQKRNHSEID